MSKHCICRVQPIIRLLINMLFIYCLFAWFVCVSIYLLDLFFSIWFPRICSKQGSIYFEVITSTILRSPPWLGRPLRNICVTNDHGYVPLVVSIFRSFPHSWLITGFVTRLTRRVSLVEQELLTLPDHLGSPPVFSGVRVTRSLFLYVCFADLCLSFCTFSFGHYFVCSSSIYGFWLPLWYLQTLLITDLKNMSKLV
jgi:hypothetical protein